MIKNYRNEWKYCCTAGELERINNRLEAVLDKDKHGGRNGRYTIHSLYFDDYKDSFVKANDAGTSERIKYRIRYYGEQYDLMQLERKEKSGGRCYKTSCPLLPEEYQKLMSGDIEKVFWQTKEPLLRHFCICCMNGYLRPKAIIDFERTAFVEEITNIRITLDENISVSNDLFHFVKGDYLRYPIQEKGQHILEVKFDYILPGYIRHIVAGQNLIQSSFSKYSLGRRVLQKMGQG